MVGILHENFKSWQANPGGIQVKVVCELPMFWNSISLAGNNKNKNLDSELFILDSPVLFVKTMDVFWHFTPVKSRSFCQVNSLSAETIILYPGQTFLPVILDKNCFETLKANIFSRSTLKLKTGKQLSHPGWSDRWMVDKIWGTLKISKLGRNHLIDLTGYQFFRPWLPIIRQLLLLIIPIEWSFLHASGFIW